MFSHITVGTNDLQRAGDFYDAVLGALGHARGFERENFISYGDRSGGRFFVMNPFDGNAATVGNGGHAAFNADSRAAVDKFHAAAMAGGIGKSRMRFIPSSLTVGITASRRSTTTLTTPLV